MWGGGGKKNETVEGPEGKVQGRTGYIPVG